jgi:hypothetical protein
MGGFWTSSMAGWGRRRLAALITVMTVMSVMAVWYSFQDRSPRVRTDHASATVLEVKEAGWQVKLGTGETVWIYASSGITVRPGDTVPVRIDTYESGNRRVEFDRDRWINGG